jgi:quinol monooxygenase YgiN
MNLGRRLFLKCFSAAAAAIQTAPAGARKENSMYGLIVKLTAVPGKRDEVIALLKQSASDMSGCFSYVVARDPSDENVIWVTEVWDSLSSHDASLTLPAVKDAVPKVKPMISAFEKIAATTPVWGVGLPAAQAR